MDVHPNKDGISKAESNEQQRNWSNNLWVKKAQDGLANYDPTRAHLNFEVTKGGKVQGFFRTRTNQFIFEQKHSKGDREGKNIIYTIEKNGDVTFDDGRKVAEIKDNGEVNCHDEAPYLTLQDDGSVIMDGEKVARIDNEGKVYLYDVLIGSAPGIDKKYVAYLYLGIYYNKERLAQAKEEMAEKTNLEKRKGPLAYMLMGADVFIGVSAPNMVTADMVKPGAVIIDVGCDIVSAYLQDWTGIAHGDACSGILQHAQIILTVAEGHGL